MLVLLQVICFTKSIDSRSATTHRNARRHLFVYVCTKNKEVGHLHQFYTIQCCCSLVLLVLLGARALKRRRRLEALRVREARVSVELQARSASQAAGPLGQAGGKV